MLKLGSSIISTEPEIFRYLEATRNRATTRDCPYAMSCRGNPLWLPFAVKYLFICASVLITHELRTPLNPILGYANFLKHKAEFSKRQQNALNIIEESAQHLLRLINDILDFSHIEAHQLALFPIVIDLPAFLDNIVGMMQIHAQEKHLNLRYETSNTLPGGVEADESRLRQVLLNLLGNAIKFTETGRVILRVYTARGHNLNFYFLVSHKHDVQNRS